MAPTSISNNGLAGILGQNADGALVNPANL